MSEDPYRPPLPQPPPLPRPGVVNDPGLRFLIPVGRSALAIAAGYLGIFSLILLPAPISLIVSIIAIRDLRRSKLAGKPKLGMGRAVFGLVMGIIGTCFLAFIIVSVVMSKKAT